MHSVKPFRRQLISSIALNCESCIVAFLQLLAEWRHTTLDRAFDKRQVSCKCFNQLDKGVTAC